MTRFVQDIARSATAESRGAAAEPSHAREGVELVSNNEQPRRGERVLETLSPLRGLLPR
jgi:hypothetical protein